MSKVDCGSVKKQAKKKQAKNRSKTALKAGLSRP